MNPPIKTDEFKNEFADELRRMPRRFSANSSANYGELAYEPYDEFRRISRPKTAHSSDVHRRRPTSAPANFDETGGNPWRVHRRKPTNSTANSDELADQNRRSRPMGSTTNSPAHFDEFAGKLRRICRSKQANLPDEFADERRRICREFLVNSPIETDEIFRRFH